MKKIILLSLLLMVGFSSFASLRQSKYRWRNDDGNESTATWKAPNNTPIFLTDITETLRLRIEFDNDNGYGFSSVIDQYLYYSKDGGATWTQINTSDANDFKLVSSSFVTHGTPTTNQLGTGLGSFISGVTISNISPDLSMSLFDNQRTEIEWVIQPTMLCENFTNYKFEMTLWETTGVQGELNTDFDCDEPVITVDSIFERCGPGSLDLNASVDLEDATINWWDSPEGGSLLGTGTSITTPVYAATDTVYVEGFSGGCYSDRVPVVLVIHPLPVIDIAIPDGTVCATNGIFTIEATPSSIPSGSTYLWNTGETTSSISVPPSFGVEQLYWVEVTNEWGCTAADTVRLIINPSPEVNLGDDILVCEGSTVTLDAGNPGASFYWNTGALTQTLTVDDGGSYSVIVTNSFGCYSMDTVLVTVEGFSPTVDGIIVNNMGPKSFKFKAHNPKYVEAYKWTFGDGTSPSLSAIPTHTYAEPGTYLVTLEVSSSCGKAEFYTYATVVQGIAEIELAKNHLKVYPNPTNQLLNINTYDGVYIQKIELINTLGQKHLEQSYPNLENVQIDVQQLPAGIYYLNVHSNKGLMIQSFQVLH